MENKEVLKTLLDIYLYSDLDDEEALDNYLKENDIDVEGFIQQIEIKIRHKRAELQIEQGRKFRENYIKLLAEETLKNKERKESSIHESGFAMAYRKKSGEEDESEDDEAKKLEMIRKAKGGKKK